ncbi:MCM1 [Enterospora canceri]|uniref:MCM1 n=1 Tax=Enterospora canceri TaxID=1081671 RepID=A0A1Y1S5Y2_9MICR|nr:MCM1 [Enterospora canceri]
MENKLRNETKEKYKKTKIRNLDKNWLFGIDTSSVSLSQSHSETQKQHQNVTENIFIRQESSESEKEPRTVQPPRRTKVSLKYIQKPKKRGVSFSKRKKGVIKKLDELNVLTRAEIMLVIANESGRVYTYATDKLKVILIRQEDMIKELLDVSSEIVEEE